MSSILNDVKHTLGLNPEDTAFDLDLVLLINGTISTLTQLNVGPKVGYEIASAEETWDDFIGDDPRLNSVKTYVFLRVKFLFDPPQIGGLITAMNQQIDELGFRINSYTDYG